MNMTFMGRDSADVLDVIRSNSYLAVLSEPHLRGAEGIVVLPIESFNVLQPFYLYWSKSKAQNAFLSFIRQNIVDFFQHV